jgi:hypothetical protein
MIHSAFAGSALGADERSSNRIRERLQKHGYSMKLQNIAASMMNNVPSRRPTADALAQLILKDASVVDSVRSICLGMHMSATFCPEILCALSSFLKQLEYDNFISERKL